MPLNINSKKRDDTKLICDIGELTGLFSDAPSLQQFLQRIVTMISEHMQSEVCSIYIFSEEAQELVLRATKGLHPSSIGKVRLKLGEGLVGLAAKELRSICEKNATKNPAFKFIPGIGEEPFESFLVIPILRGHARIGAMVIQNAKKDYFDEEDVKIFRAITSQLANTIETAKILIGLDEKSKIPTKPVWDMSIKLVKAKVGAEGFAYAPAALINAEMDWMTIANTRGKKTLEDFHAALLKTEQQLEDLQRQIEEKLSDVASLIFTAQILMLKDESFVDSMAQLIHAGRTPGQAVVHVVHNYVEKFESLADAYLREKAQDVKDVGFRLLQNLIGEDTPKNNLEGKIVIARELFPSDILKYSSQKASGFILLSGGVTSHLSILSRSLGVPFVIAQEEKLLQIPTDTKILLDAEVGNIYINPSDEVVNNFKKRNETRAAVRQSKITVNPVTKTKDGRRIILQSNINLLSDLKTAKELYSEGIGLYRSEFPFIVRNNFPTEEEQFVVYQRLVDGMPEQEITFRTLDIGGDKVLSYFNFGKEENPFLGMRSIRFSLKYQDIFSQQIRAILRAGVKADLRIMFPMISSVDEFLQAKGIVLSCLKDLAKEGIPCHKKPKIGMMVELPSILEVLDELSKEADFFCIGTNDFIQYMLAVDRTNEKVADLYVPHHPAVLRGLKKIVDCANKAKIDVSICGDMVQEEQYIPFLIGIGLKKFSVAPQYLPRIQSRIDAIDYKLACTKAEVLLSKNKLSDIQKLL